MKQEYEKVKNLRPEFHVSRDGKITISGLGNLEKSNEA
jgi:hypothetical protein